MSKSSNNGMKVGAAALLIVACGVYTYSAWSRTANGLRAEAAAERAADPNAPPPPPGFDQPAGRPSGGPGSGGRGGPGGFGGPQRMMDELGLDQGQRDQIEKLRAQYLENDATRDFPKFLEESRKLLTPEQLKKADEMRGQMRARGEQMMARREAEAKKVLSPEDFATWQRKAQEMRARFAAGGPGGFFRGGRGGNGAPPPPPPGNAPAPAAQ